MAATRAAALLHAAVTLLAHVAGRPLWSTARNGDGGRNGNKNKSDKHHSPPQPSVWMATAWALVSLASGTALWTALSACFGVSALYKLTVGLYKLAHGLKAPGFNP
jgi:hypothetical protein